MDAKILLQGAYDLHIHTAPDVVPRKLTDLETAKRLSALGMRGYALKSHQFNTGGRAAIIRELHPGFNAVGCVTLNPAMGGINPAATEMAGRYGVKIVWFPTVGAKNETDFLQRSGSDRTYGAGPAPMVETFPITVFDEAGRLRPEVLSVLELIKHFGMVMATGHLSKEESLALVKAGRAMGLEKMVVTHPDFPECRASLREQAEYVRHGAMLEFCYHTVWSGCTSYEEMTLMLRNVGSEHAIVTSDLGQPNTPEPDTGFLGHIGKLLEHGISEREIRTLIVDNPRFLVE